MSEASGEIRIRVQARAGREALGPIRDGALLVRVAAPPLEGRANKAACRLIARRLGVAPSRVAVVRGEHGREKLIRVQGLDSLALRAALLDGS